MKHWYTICKQPQYVCWNKPLNSYLVRICLCVRVGKKTGTQHKSDRFREGKKAKNSTPLGLHGLNHPRCYLGTLRSGLQDCAAWLLSLEAGDFLKPKRNIEKHKIAVFLWGGVGMPLSRLFGTVFGITFWFLREARKVKAAEAEGSQVRLGSG